MKKKQKEEIRAKSLSELEGEAEKRQIEIRRLKMEIKIAKVKNTSSLKQKLDELAVVKTIMQEKRFQNENA